MKVVLIYRHKGPGAYSIEDLFHTIAGELQKHVEVIEYEVGTRWDLFKDVWKLRKMRADIYHVTGAVYYFALPLPHRKTVITVHDIYHYQFGLRGWKRWTYKWLWLILPIRAAHAVTTVSEETRNDIVRSLSCFDTQIKTIENCHSPFLKPVCRPFHPECPVILQIGTAPHKNIARLAEALQGIKCQLVLIGRLDIALKRKLVECGVDYVNRFDLTHQDICEQYFNCDMVSFLSLREGFGVPIIEAQACGRPLISANLSPLREVAGDGACLVDPLDVEQIRAGILRIIGDSTYRDQLVERGLQNAIRYSPARISDQYLNLYKQFAHDQHQP